MMESLQEPSLRNAVVAGLLATVACGITGAYVAAKRMVSVSGGVAHASLGGVGIGLYLGLSPVPVALGFTLAAAIGIGFVIRTARLTEDTAIAMLWAMGMSIGVVFAAFSPARGADLSGYLFGDIFAVPVSDFYLMGAVDAILVFVLLAFYREILALAFDPEFGRIVGVPTGRMYYLMLSMVALTVVSLLRVAGIILVVALLAIPATLARRFTFHFGKLVLLSWLFSFLFIFAGLYIAWRFDLPSGAVIALLSGAVFFLVGIRR